MKKMPVLFLSALLLTAVGTPASTVTERSVAMYTQDDQNGPSPSWTQQDGQNGLSSSWIQDDQNGPSPSWTQDGQNGPSPSWTQDDQNGPSPSWTQDGQNGPSPSWTQDTAPDADAPDSTKLPPADESGGQLRLPGVPFADLPPHETVVYNYAEFKSALANNNGITTVYLGADITMQTTGVSIHTSKTGVVIAGLNPLEPSRTQPYTLTDHASALFTDTVYIGAAGTSTLHIRDLNIVGKNYYGPFGVIDTSATAGVTVIYERVTYSGPQIGYHRRGTIRFKDCAVSIHGDNGGSVNQEAAEAKHIVFEGTNTLDTVSSANSVFWIPSGGTFTLADDASLTLTSPNTSAAYGVFYADGYANKVIISIGRRAVWDLTIATVVAPALNVTLSGFTVREGGRFHLTTTKAASGILLEIDGALLVEKDAQFIISGYGGASYAALRQENGDITLEKDALFEITAGSAYASLLHLVGRALLCGDPASVLLYNAGRAIAASSADGRITLNTQQVNYWKSLSPGDLDHPPLYGWRKADGTHFVLNATIAASGDTSALSSNFAPGDPPGTAPDTSNFSMAGARVLAFGKLSLIAAQPTTKSTSIGGVTAPGAAVRVSFTQEGQNYTFPDVTADANGVFHVPIDVALLAATQVTIQSGWRYLTATAQTTVSDEGKLAFFVPELMEFSTADLTSSAKMVNRVQPDWEITVSDTRGMGGGWRLFARLNNEMTPASAHRPILEGALVYLDSQGGKTVMGTDSDILIWEHSAAGDEEVIPVVWSEDAGILLNIQPGTAFTDTAYSASIAWTLTDAP